MNVLFVPYSEISGVGGVEVVVLRLCEKLNARGWTCGIAEMAGTARAPRVLADSGIRVWTVVAPSQPRLRRPRSWAAFARAAWQFKRIVNAVAPDVVHVHFPAGQALPVLGASMFPHRWRLAVTLLGSDVRGNHSDYIRTWQARLLRRADAVTAVSASLRDDAVRRFPFVSDKIRVIHNGVDRSWFDRQGASRPRQDRYFLFLGRLHPVKQVDLLLRAWALIRNQVNGVQLRIVGDGPERESLRRLADDLNLGSSVMFTGFVANEELPTLYRDAEAVVLPSRGEGLPLVLLEAGASGTVMIGTNVPGISDVIRDNVNGYLSKDGSPDDLGAVMLRTLQMSPIDRLRMRAAAEETIRTHFFDEAIVGAYEQLYRSVQQGAR
jgi:glycosyltransferase involved in cell wall biosynthesis